MTSCSRSSPNAPATRQRRSRIRTEEDRAGWQVFRRAGKRGLVSVEVSQGDRVPSRQLKCWFRTVGTGGAMRIRIGVGARGEELVPTEAEALRAAAERERAEKQSALARVRELEAKLARIRRPRSGQTTPPSTGARRSPGSHAAPNPRRSGLRPLRRPRAGQLFPSDASSLRTGSPRSHRSPSMSDRRTLHPPARICRTFSSAVVFEVTAQQ